MQPHWTSIQLTVSLALVPVLIEWWNKRGNAESRQVIASDLSSLQSGFDVLKCQNPITGIPTEGFHMPLTWCLGTTAWHWEAGCHMKSWALSSGGADRAECSACIHWASVGFCGCGWFCLSSYLLILTVGEMLNLQFVPRFPKDQSLHWLFQNDHLFKIHNVQSCPSRLRIQLALRRTTGKELLYIELSRSLMLIRKNGGHSVWWGKRFKQVLKIFGVQQA